MSVSIIAACARNRVIGAGNRLPWHLPEDLARFKRLTTGRCIVMGRKTFESIGKPLPKRTSIVVTRGKQDLPAGVKRAGSVEEALALATGEVFVIGGAEIYRQTLDRADRLYLTLIDADVEGDVLFPELDLRAWREVERDDRPRGAGPFAYSFVTYERALVKQP